MFLPVPVSEMPGSENPKSLVDLLGSPGDSCWKQAASPAFWPVFHSSMGAPKETSQGTVLISSDFI